MRTKCSISFVMQYALLVCCVAHGELANNPHESPRCNDWVPITVTSTAGRIDSFFSSDELTYDLVVQCLKGGADPNAIEEGLTPLSAAAAMSSDPAIIEVLLEAGARDHLALHSAASNDDPRIAEKLLAMGADVNARNAYGDTPLHAFAGRTAKPHLIAALVGAGSDPDARTNTGETPLSYAVRHNDAPEIVTALLDAGADPNSIDDEGTSPLHHAAGPAQDVGIVNALIDAGANVGAKDAGGRTPMHWAVIHDDRSSTSEIVTDLAEAGADPNQLDYVGQSPLHLATRFAVHPKTIQTLLAIGARIDEVDAPNVLRESHHSLSMDEEAEIYTDPIILRARRAVLDRSRLLNSALNSQSIHLNLFEDVDLKATLKKSPSSSSGSVFMSGSLEQGGHITLFVGKEGIVRGEVHSPEGVYTIRTSRGQRGSQEVTIRQIDTSQLPVIDHGAMDVDRLDSRVRGNDGWSSSGAIHSDNWIPASAGLKALGELSVIQNDRSHGDDEEESSDRTVDILVVYTPNAEAHEGGKAEIEATIRAEIEKTNQAFSNSGLSHRKIKLVAMEKVDYTQTDNMSDDLRVLRDKKGDYYDPDGLLDEALELREKVGADVVHFFVEKATGACGLAIRYYDLYDKNSAENACANAPNPDECMVQERKELWRKKGFGVSAISEGCTVQYSFTHELGHNFGLWHDRYVESYLSLDDSINFPYTPYGFGYVNQNFDRSICFNTMMAYKDQCVDEGYVGSNGVKEPMFSNPDVELGSEEVGFDPAGVPGDEWTVELDGPVNASRAIDDVWDIVANLFSKTESGHDVPYMPASGDDRRQGFVRVVNHTHEAGEVTIEAFDDAGTTYDRITLSIDANKTAHFNSDDLEMGNAAKGLSAGVGTGEGDWRLKLTSLLEIEVLAYARTDDGFLTSMHDLMPASRAGRRAPFFNPGSNENQVSRLRLVNDHEQEVEAVVTAVDDVGVGSEVRVTIPPNTARTFTAKELEEGSEEFEGSLGDGKGKWRLFVENVDRTSLPYSDKEVRVMAMSLLESPTGHLTNLSTVPRNEYQGTHTVPLFPSKTAQARQGFARVVNLNEEPAEVSVLAYDDNGSEYGPAILSLDGNGTAHFNSDDLEDGNEAKGLSGGIGSGQGDWRLELTSESKLEVLAYVRTDDGFVTTMHEAVPSRIHSHRAAVFNPASNADQVSSLRLVNPGDEDAEVTITGIDGDGLRTEEIRVTVPAKASRTLTSQELEAGGSGFQGSLGDGSGKWQIEIEADREIVAMSLLGSPTGHLTNLSTAPVRGVGPWPPAEMAQ